MVEHDKRMVRTGFGPHFDYLADAGVFPFVVPKQESVLPAYDPGAEFFDFHHDDSPSAAPATYIESRR
ncbi:hypothetical protein SDC9_139875 [bioreactor metagenome]|uniref:Uncharacterized protein n=1 Tax=bioreactor metagenome TaxID=1076179 RepID=A0A645DTY9_9ZZZZ